MKQLLLIPDRKNLETDAALAKQYGLGYEYNDFFYPAVLDDERLQQEILDMYGESYKPGFATMHGAFFDVIPFSPDEKIRAISMLRIEQSLKVARRCGAGAVVFHTNYNPFLNAPLYVKDWIVQNEKIWSSILEKHADINIYLENMFDTTPEIMKELSSCLCRYKNYGVCLDYAHAALSNVAPRIWAESLQPYIKHVHINDNDLVSDLHLAWGDGRMDRQDFYEAYEKYMNGADVLIETATQENKRRSLETLEKDGFLQAYRIQ